MRKISKKTGIKLLKGIFILATVMFSALALIVMPFPFNWVFAFLGVVIGTLTWDAMKTNIE